MSLFLYRTTDSDTDGDPIDFGLVRAKNDKDATRFIGQHLIDLLGKDAEHFASEFYLYELIDTSKDGVISSKAKTTRSTISGKKL